MASPVEDAIADIKTKILEVTAVKNKVIAVYDQDDLINMQQRYGFPSVGIMYSDLSARGEAGKKQGIKGAAADLTIDLLVVGAEQCTNKITDVSATTIALLNSIREEILCTTLVRTTGGAQRTWAFVREAPVNIDENLLGYIQRWQTRVILTNG